MNYQTHYKKLSNSRGAAAILITMLILTLIVTVSLIITRLMVQEIRVSRDIVKSFKAYEMAVAGMERGSYLLKSSNASFSVSPGGIETYTVTYDGINLLTSIGRYSDVERRLDTIR